MQTQKIPHDFAIDLLRLIAILAVVGIHTTTLSLQLEGKGIHANIAFFLNQILRFAVPLFFLISGFILYKTNHQRPAKEFIYKRLKKIALPYVVWSAFYYLVVFPHQAPNFFTTLLGGTAAYHLYFIPTLCIFYALFPFIIRFSTILLHPLFLLFTCIAELYLLQQAYYHIPVEISSPVSVALLNSGMYVLGIALSKYQPIWEHVLNTYRTLFLSLTILLAFIVFYQGISQYRLTHNYQRYYSQWRPTVFVYTLCLTSTFYSYTSTLLRSAVPISYLASLSFFVFFIHVALLQIARTIITRYDMQSIAQAPVAVILLLGSIVGLSFLLGFFVHKSKFLTQITG